MSENNGKTSFTPTLIFATFITCFGSSMLYGYNLSVLNLPGPYVKCFFTQTILKQEKDCAAAVAYSKNNTNNRSAEITIKEAKGSSAFDESFYYGMVNAAFVVAGAIGAFSTGLVADKIGRRNGLMFNSLFAIVGGIIAGPTVAAKAPALLYVGRFIIGINCGITIGLASMYLTEIAPRDVRGIIGACHQLAVTIGIVVGNILTLDSFLNNVYLWPIAQALTAVPALIGLALLPFCPESPRFLYLKKNDVEGAKTAFQKVNVVEDVEHFVEEMRGEENPGNQESFRFIQLFTKKDLRLAITIACLIQVMQQLSGVNAVVGYSGTLLETAGVTANVAQYFVVGLGVWNVVLTIISLPLIERAGRRTLLLWPSAVLAVSLILLVITVNLHASATSAKTSLSIISVVGCYIFMAAFALGLGPVPALIVSEVTRQETRAAAYSVSQALQWVSNLIVMSSYPSLNDSIGGWVFMVYFVILVACWVFFFFFMPETRNRTFDEVARDLALFKKQVGQTKKKSFYKEDLGGENGARDAKAEGNDSQPEGMPLMERSPEDVAIA